MTTTTPKPAYTRTQQLKAIDLAWTFICDRLNNIKMEAMGDNYEGDNQKEEREHRGCGLPRIPHGLTVPQAGRLFCVKQLLDYLDGEKAPDPKDFLWMRKTIFTAYALVANYRDEITKALAESGADLDAIRSADYAELNA
jgi:hypothetical protein